MNAAVVNVLGQPPRYQPFPEPDPGPGEVLVRVRAAGLHPVVKALASGSHYASAKDDQGPSIIPGIDGVGVLNQDGSRVFFVFVRRPWGTMAERAAAPGQCACLFRVIRRRPGRRHPQSRHGRLAHLEDRAGLVPGETGLIFGATGVAGLWPFSWRAFSAPEVIAAGRNLDSLPDVRRDHRLDQPEDEIRNALAAEATRALTSLSTISGAGPPSDSRSPRAGLQSPGPTRKTRLVEVGETAGKTITLPVATL